MASLVGSEDKVSVKILRNTAFVSSIQALVLQFSEESDTGCSVPVLGIGTDILKILLHNVMLYFDLLRGPALPSEGTTLILGNGVAGGCVRVEDPPPPPVASSVPFVRKQSDENEVDFP